MIHVCPLSRLHDLVEETGALHVVTLVRAVDVVVRPKSVAAENHLILDMDDIVDEIPGMLAPHEDHVAQLIDFAQRWDRKRPLVVHCWAGISRSTAAAYVAACALAPHRDESEIARRLRAASPTASPNPRIVALGDDHLGRRGRMIDALDRIGPAEMAHEAEPFKLIID
jgi:predicted protein tyrosine phosphatase